MICQAQKNKEEACCNENGLIYFIKMHKIQILDFGVFFVGFSMLFWCERNCHRGTSAKYNQCSPLTNEK